MKVLRKCACVAVQLVVTTALLFQQCPVKVIALGMEWGSDYVEIPASGEGADVEDDSPADPPNDDNSNGAAPTTAEKVEAASGADNAVGTDNAKQNTLSDGDAANSGDAIPASVSASDEELVWNRLGTLEWSKDANKNVILRPADGVQSGSYEGEILASQVFGYDINSFSIQGQVTVSSIIFRQCAEMVSAHLSGLTVVGDSLRGMFMRCQSLKNVSFFGVEAPSVTDMSHLFSECSSLENISFGGLNAPAVEEISSLFGKCSSHKSVDFDGVAFPKVKDMDWMFYGCSNLEVVDLKAFDNVLIERLGLIHLFDGCSSLREVKLPNLDLSMATSLEYMFNDCQSLSSIQLPIENSSNVRSTKQMFANCRSLHEIDLTCLDTGSVIEMSSMFVGCDSLVSVSLSKKFSFGQISNSSKKPCLPSSKYGRWISSVDGIAYSSDSIPSSVDSTYSLQDEKAILDCWNQVGSCVWKVSSKDGVLIVKPLNGSFGSIDFRSDVYPDYDLWLRYKSEIKEARFVGDIKLIGDLDRRFSGCSNLCSIDFGSANTSEVTSFSSLFEDCRSLSQITLGSGFVSKPGITCRLLFPDTGASSSGLWRSSTDGVCYSYDQIPSGVSATYLAVKSVDSSQWNSCGSCLWSVDESGTLKIKPSNGTSGYLSTSFRWRDVKPEKIKEVKTYGIIELPGSSERMFDGLANVVSMDLSAFDFSKCKTLEGLFFNCRSLKRIKWGDPDTSSVIDMSNMFRNCSSLESIDLGIYETNQLNNVSYMFYGCSSLSNLNESLFDTSHVTKMAGFFPESSRLQSVSFSSKFKLVGKVDLPRTIITPSDTVVPIKWRDGTGSDYDYNMIPAGFNIPVSAKAALSTDYFAIDLSDVVYTGEPISKDISCVVGYDLEDICSVELKNNVNVGVASIVLTGKGLFSGEISYGFNIVKADPDRPVLKTFDATYGQKLSDIYLPSGFEWQDPSTDVGDPGVNSFECNWGGDSNHNGLSGIEVKVRVTRPVEASMFSVDAEGLAYTGRAHEPAVTSEVVPEGSFSVSYRDNVAAGKAAAVVKGSGFYTGTCEIPFTIAKAKPSYKAPAGIAAIYGQKLSDVKLPEGFSWEDPSLSVGNPGENTFKCGYAAPDENHTGAEGIEVKVRVTRPVESSMFSVDAKGLVYNGEAHEPAVSSEVVPEGSFSVSYRDNVAAGKAAAVVKGSGFYTGTCEIPFTIAKAKPSYKAPAGIAAIYGQKLSDVKLPEGFSWEDPSLSVGNPGENTFKCGYAAPDENHTGAEGIEVKVRVTRPVESSMFSVDAKGLVYNGEAHEPAVSSEVVPEGSFSVSYRDNVAAGKAAAVVKGSGFYTGTCEIPFTIAKAKPSYKAPAGIAAIYGQKLSDVKLPEGFSWEDPSLSVGNPGENTFKCGYAAPDENHTGAEGIEVKVRVTRPVESSMFSVDAKGLVYNGEAHEPAVSSEVVPEGSFSVSYRDNVAAGKAVAVVKGSGFYTGTCEVSFTIAKAKPSYTVPATLKGIYGKKLSDVKLPEGFSWSDPSVCIDWYGSKGIKATYTPSDTKNYEVVKGIEVSVFVGRSVITVPTIKDLVYSGSVQAPSVSIDGIHVVKNAGGINVGQYSIEFALDDPVLDCWEDGTTENKTVTYGIVPANISAAEIAPISPCLLKNGKAEPALKATFKGSALAAGRDYTVSYANNKKVGTASVVIKGKGNFTGERAVSFKIAKGDLGDYNVRSKRVVYLYNGKAVTPRIFVSAKDGGDVPREGVDYKVTYANSNAVGTGHATVSGIGDYIGSKTVDFTIADAIDLNTYCFVHVPDAFYTGNEVCPTADVRLKTESAEEAYGNGGASRSEDSPIEGRDYTVSYEDNINPGMATAIVTGRGKYKGQVRTQFHVLRKGDFGLSDCSVLFNPPADADKFSYAEKGGKYSFMYTGSAIEPTVSVSLYNDSGVYVELRNGVDYEVSYRSNTEPGSATVVVRGINGLTGSQTIGFNIVRKLSVADLSLSKYDFEQSVYQLKPGFALAPKLKRSSSFVEGADYKLSYANCDKVGNGLVTVTGIGRYTGSTVVEIPIVESLGRPLLSDCKFGKIKDQVYTGSEIYPSVVLKNASGAEVDQTMECSLRYLNNVNVGKATVSACESMYYSSYIGETSTSFNILPANINDAYFVPISDASYTGSAIEPDVLVRFNGKTLAKGKDYDLSYFDNVKVGTARVTVTGKGNFNGKHEMTFKIVRSVITFDQDMVEGKTVSTSWTKKVNITNYRMVLEKGGMVRIRTSFSRIDTVLCSIQNENGDIIQSWSPSDGGDYGFFALPAGTYYFQYIGSPKSYGGSVYASYSMTPFGEPADTIYEAEDNNGTADGHTIAGDATPIEIGRCFAGSNYYAITGGYGDLDYFKFTVTKRGHYSMSLSTNARLMFALTDSQGHTLNNRDTGSDIVAQSYSDSLTGLDFGTLEPGTYYVLVLSKDKNAIGAAYYGYIFDSSDPAPTKKGVGRVSGNTRYDTMGSLTERGNWAKGGSVVLASGANYPDALAASSLAGGFNGPILLTDPNGLSGAAKNQLELLCPSKVFIVGGNAAVSPAVERQVKELLGSGCAVFRVAGQTRYETSLVAAEINPKSSDTVIVATGGNYADALSVSPYAFASGSPVVLCDKSSGLTAGAMGTIRSKAYSKAVIVGGTAAVPAPVERQLRSAGVKNITRLSGATRYETSTKIADFELKSGLGFTMDGVMLATGKNFPDALSAGPLAGRSHSPLLLVDPGASYVSSYLSNYKGQVRSATVVGGAAAVPERDRATIARVLGI